jgi:hypothetical protein
LAYPRAHNERMRRRALALLLPSLLLAACASGPRTLEIPRAQLEAALARRFPIETRAGDLFSFKVAQPQLALLPESNRLRLDFDVEAMNRVVPRAVRGALSLSFALRWEASDASIRLTQVRAERFDVQGLPESLRRELQPLGIAVAERVLEDMSLRTFRPDELARAQGYTPGAIRVTPTGVLIELLPPAGRLTG